MSEVLTVDAILFGLLVLSGIIGNILVISVVRLTANPNYDHVCGRSPVLTLCSIIIRTNNYKSHLLDGILSDI